MSSPDDRDEYRQHIFDHILVKRTRLRTRNAEKREWSLVAKTDIPIGTFIAFFTGSMSTLASSAQSLYAVDMGPGQPTIVPFPDEDHITPQERDRNPLACSNEPAEGQHANMHLMPQDFARSEISGIETLYNNDIAHYFRGLAAFACRDIEAGEQLTWHYGSSYEPNRLLMNYAAGFPCKRILEDEPFVQNDSKSVLDTLTRVQSYCVYPVVRAIKSERFRTKRPARIDSEGEESVASSSGSHEEAYKPRPSKRRSD